MAIDISVVSRALHEGGAIPVFQPIIQADESHVSYEVLGRIRVGETILPPAQFLPLLEGTPLQVDFDRAILIGAIRQAGVWYKETGTPVHIHVNASQEVLESDGYVTLLREMLYTHGLPPHTLTVEILETCRLFWENQRILETLRQLRATGVRIAIDDFPTCESPEELLSWMHRQHVGDFHTLKLDRSIVQKTCGGSESHRDAILSYIAFAHDHYMCVVAEGLETEREVNLMRELGVDEFQGFFFGKPEVAQRAYHLQRTECFAPTAPAKDRIPCTV